jgi:hypothetical protein
LSRKDVGTWERRQLSLDAAAGEHEMLHRGHGTEKVLQSSCGYLMSVRQGESPQIAGGPQHQRAQCLWLDGDAVYFEPLQTRNCQKMQYREAEVKGGQLFEGKIELREEASS